jgi:hypothetical protein
MEIQGRAKEAAGMLNGFAKERFDMYRQMKELAKTYSSEVKSQMLNMAVEVMLPKSVSHVNGKLSPVLAGLIQYGSTFKDTSEFVNVFAQIVGTGVISGRTTGKTLSPEEILTSMPEEQAMFAKAIYRDVADQMSVVSDTLSNPKARKAFGFKAIPFPAQTVTLFKEYADMANKMLECKEPQLSLAKAQRLMDALEGFSWKEPVSPMTYAEDEIKQMFKQFDAPYVPATPISQPSVQKALDEIKVIYDGTQQQLFGPEVGIGERPRDPKEILADKQYTEPKYKWPKEKQDNLPFEVLPNPIRPVVPVGAFWKHVGLTQAGLDHLTRRGLPLAHDVLNSISQLIATETDRKSVV